MDTHCDGMLVDNSELPHISVEVKLAVSGSEGRGKLPALEGVGQLEVAGCVHPDTGTASTATLCKYKIHCTMHGTANFVEDLYFYVPRMESGGI